MRATMTSHGFGSSSNRQRNGEDFFLFTVLHGNSDGEFTFKVFLIVFFTYRVFQITRMCVQMRAVHLSSVGENNVGHYSPLPTVYSMYLMAEYIL